MKIGIVSLAIGRKDSAGQQIRDLAFVNSLSRLGFQVYVFSPYVQDHKEGNVCFYKLSMKHFSPFYLKSLIKWGRDLIYDFSSLYPFVAKEKGRRRLRMYFSSYSQLVEEFSSMHDIDILQGQGHKSTYLCLKARKDLGIPLVFDKQGLLMEEFVRTSYLKLGSKMYLDFKSARKRVLEGSDRIIVVSEAMKEYLIAKDRMSSTKIVIIPCGGTVSRKRRMLRDNQVKTVIYTGRFSYWERVVDYVQAAEYVLSENPSVSFLLVGKGPQKRDILKMVKEKGLPIKYSGALTHEECLNLVAKCDIGVAPSSTDITRQVASPVKIFDYMSCGLPIVTVKVGGWSRMVEKEESGIVVEPCNPRAIAKAILYLVENPQVSNRMGQNGINAIAERHNWEHIISGKKEMYHKLSKRELQD